MITWTLFFQVIIVLLVLYILAVKDGRVALAVFIKKILEIATSKRFITLMIATWFVFKRVPIDSNWLILAGFFIGVDTMQNNGMFTAFSEFIKNKKAGSK